MVDKRSFISFGQSRGIPPRARVQILKVGSIGRSTEEPCERSVISGNNYNRSTAQSEWAANRSAVGQGPPSISLVALHSGPLHGSRWPTPKGLIWHQFPRMGHGATL